MDFHLPKLTVLLFLVTGLTVVSVSAQQSIIFSSPQTNIPQPTTPDNSQPGILPGTLQAPMQFFNFNPPRDQPPAMAAPADSPQQLRMKKLLQERKNWALMTPEEILGTSTMEKMTHTPELDALGREKNPSQLEKYLERESQLRLGSTNGLQNDQDASPWNFSRDQKKTSPLDTEREGATLSARNVGKLQAFKPNKNAFANQKADAGWSALIKPLKQIQNPTKPDLEQLASMERFRQMLDASPAPSAVPSPDSKYFAGPKPVVDPFITQPYFEPNSAGASFIVPIKSGIARPTGLTPLPSVTTAVAPPVTAPVSRIQPPPWLLQGPQPFVMPQRKF
ncbi:MAG: hypothetical protein WDN00_06955 [Limisphaerales bacterium]